MRCFPFLSPLCCLAPLARVAGRRFVAGLLGLLLPLLPAAAQRLSQTLNSGWQFSRADAAADFATARPPAGGWTPVSLPHTWNAHDVLDDAPGYYRGLGWYRRPLVLPAEWQRRPVYLYFEGANQQAEVYVNGQLASRHAGGYRKCTPTGPRCACC
ncbi:hypothetical protein EJV47_17000 [Hymenobacter gummosus]|uniref:Uncharacterized protein n=1 Tax=Hymenobacter gummosus TaxID=1776032 RepID=A0A431U0I2_9BACT|nr:sugar-binding domain-containing protein [Hymenobacter gummosus]RTQ48133.1 hypothetical protein EJV47_17000 [Hymenobacter gummosus]